MGPSSLRMRLIVGLAGLVLAGVAVERARNAGLTFDEPLHLEGLRGVLAHASRVLAGAPADYREVPGNLEFYGIGALVPAYGLAALLDRLTDWPEILRWSAALHLVAQLSYLACLWSCWQTLSPQGRAAALLATLALALLPEFLGHGLMNYKDMPVAAGVMFCLQATLAIWRRAAPGNLAALGAALLWLGAQKLAALPLVLPCLALVPLALARQRQVRLWWWLSGVALATALLLFAATPQAWAAPWGYLRHTLAEMARFHWGSCMLAAGRCYGPDDPDWSPLVYLGQWVPAKIPLAYLLAWVLAALLALRRPNATALLSLALVGSFLLAIAVAGSTLYDALRHLLFLLPPLCCLLGASGLLAARPARLAAGLVLVWLAAENLRFYPYGYAWFTPLTAAEAARGGYDGDYWGYALRAAIERVPAGAAVSGQPRILVEPLAALAPRDEAAGSYFVHFLRWGAAPPAGCSPVDRIARRTLLGEEIVLSGIARCGGGR